jgi:IS5 family transposase
VTGGKQLGFSDYEQITAKKQTKREKFLSEMEAVVPWLRWSGFPG